MFGVDLCYFCYWSDIIVIDQYGVGVWVGLLHAGRVHLMACVVDWLCNGRCALDVLRTG